MDVHQDMMKDGTEAKRNIWMERFHKDWENAEEI